MISCRCLCLFSPRRPRHHRTRRDRIHPRPSGSSGWRTRVFVLRNAPRTKGHGFDIFRDRAGPPSLIRRDWNGCGREALQHPTRNDSSTRKNFFAPDHANLVLFWIDLSIFDRARRITHVMCRDGGPCASLPHCGRLRADIRRSTPLSLIKRMRKIDETRQQWSGVNEETIPS